LAASEIATVTRRDRRTPETGPPARQAPWRARNAARCCHCDAHAGVERRSVFLAAPQVSGSL